MPGPIHTILPRPPRFRRLRHPSTWWPSVANRQDEAFRNIWQALRQHDRIQAGYTDLAAHRARAGHVVVCAIRIPDQEDIRAALAPLLHDLERLPFVRLAPFESLIIAIQELGYLVDEESHPDDTTRAKIDEFIEQASSPVCDFPRFEIRIGGFNSFLDTPFLDVHDDGWCYRVHHRLRDFTLLPLDDSFAYLPHVPLGYYTENAPMQNYPALMARWRDRTFGTFDVEAIELLAIPTADPLAEPEILHRFELGHTLGAAETITNNTPGEMYE